MKLYTINESEQAKEYQEQQATAFLEEAANYMIVRIYKRSIRDYVEHEFYDASTYSFLRPVAEHLAILDDKLVGYHVTDSKFDIDGILYINGNTDGKLFGRREEADSCSDPSYYWNDYDMEYKLCKYPKELGNIPDVNFADCFIRELSDLSIPHLEPIC